MKRYISKGAILTVKCLGNVKKGVREMEQHTRKNALFNSLFDVSEQELIGEKSCSHYAGMWFFFRLFFFTGAHLFVFFLFFPSMILVIHIFFRLALIMQTSECTLIPIWRWHFPPFFFAFRSDKWKQNRRDSSNLSD